MVIGNGLLSNAFSKYKLNEEILVFASGVSNSSSNNQQEFGRELSLLDTILKSQTRLIYFSTISIYDPDLKDNLYINHKRKIESIIRESSNDYLIFRLPILVGHTKNPFTLCNHIANQINSNKPIKIFKNACRYLIDVDDLSLILPIFIENKSYINITIDVNYNNQITMENLVAIFENLLRKKIEKIYFNRGGCYKSDNRLFLAEAQKQISLENPNYISECIAKYYS